MRLDTKEKEKLKEIEGLRLLERKSQRQQGMKKEMYQRKLP